MIISLLILGYSSLLSVKVIYYAFTTCSFRNKKQMVLLRGAATNLDCVCASTSIIAAHS